MDQAASREAGPLIDAHCHLGESPAGSVTARQLIERLDQNGVAVAIVSAGRVTGPSDIPAANEMVLEAVRAHPSRLIGFALTDPTAQDNAAQQLARALGAGLAGVKLRPGVAGFASAGAGLRAVAEVAHERRAPIYCHSGSQILSVVKDALLLASEFPDLPIILSYRKGPSVKAPVTESVPANLYFDTSSLPAEYIRSLIREVGVGKVIFGSGFPFGSQKIELSKAYRAVPPDAVPAVFGGNIRAVLARCGIEVPS